MIIHPATSEIVSGRVRVSAMIEIETKGTIFSASGTSKHELWIEWPADYYNPTLLDGAPFTLICLPLAMCLNERLVVSDSLPKSLVLNSLEAMAIYESDFPDLCRVADLDALSYTPMAGDSSRIASFYSGGVDSLFNIAEMRRLNARYGTGLVTDLWLVHGMDIALADTALWEEVRSSLMAPFAETRDVRCVDIATNAREIHDLFVGWEELGFSAILGGIAKCFSNEVSTVLIGSYAKYQDIVPHSSSPLVDPMWSCDQQSVRHFTCRADRIQKLQTIIDQTPELLENLRVCYVNTGGSYNCGLCEKCIRTQMQLKLCGALDACARFDVPLSADSLRHVKLPWRKKNQYSWDFWRDIQIECRKAGFDDYDRAIGRNLRRNHLRRSLKRGGDQMLKILGLRK